VSRARSASGLNHEKNVIMVMAPKNSMTDNKGYPNFAERRSMTGYAETYEFEPFN